MTRTTGRVKSPASVLSRRQVLAAGVSLAIAAIVPRHVLGGPGQTPPSEKLSLAGVGVGGQGGWDLQQLNEHNIVALADVDWTMPRKHSSDTPKRRSTRTFANCSIRKSSTLIFLDAQPTRVWQASHAPRL